MAVLRGHRRAQAVERLAAGPRWVEIPHINGVLLIDCDPQGNATLFAGAEAVPGKTMAEVLLGERSLQDVIIGSAVQGLWIAPAMRSLNAAVVALTRDFGVEHLA